MIQNVVLVSGVQQSYSVICIPMCVCVCSVVPALCNPPGSSVHGIFQARILKWVVISFSKVSSKVSNPHFLSLLHWQADSLPLCHIQTYPLFLRFLSPTGHHRILSRGPCVILQVLISYLFYRISLNS